MLIVHHYVEAQKLKAIIEVRTRLQQASTSQNYNLFDLHPEQIKVKTLRHIEVFQLLQGPFVVCNLLPIHTSTMGILVDGAVSEM